MELLKNILRQAIAAGATRVRLTAGQVAEITTLQGAVPSERATPISPGEIAQLLEFLFPNDRAALAAQQPTRGVLNVPSVGRILLIASPKGPASLMLYPPPAGAPVCESDWAALSTNSPGALASLPLASVKPSSVSVAGVTAPLPSQRAPDGVGAVASPSSAGPLVAAMKEPEGGALPTSLPFSNDGGFQPDLTAPLPVTASQDRTASPPGERPAFSMGFVPSYLPQEDQKTAPASTEASELARLASSMQFPSHVVEGPSGFSGEISPSLLQQPNVAKPRVDFGPDADGMSSKSQGDNPIDAILTEMVKRRASDVHITGGEPYCYRIDGDITRIGQNPVTSSEMEAFLVPIMPPRNQLELAQINDTDFAYEIDGVGRFRVNVFRDRNGVGTVIRHIPSTILTVEQLALPPAILKLCTLTKGLVLVTGPTGSGKSTTLAAMIDLINKTRADHILTIEDPIEFVHSQQRCLVNQREVHKHTGSFARALKAALREDPDVVLIGEMRDLETIAIAIETAETGHLVFGTLHTSTAVSTVDRIIDQFPSDRQEQIRMMLASSLKGVVAQTLLKKKGGGRVAAHEILITADAVSAMVREGKNHMITNHMQSQKADGNQLLTESLAKLVQGGIVDAEEALRKAIDKQALVDLLSRMGIKIAAAQATLHGKSA